MRHSLVARRLALLVAALLLACGGTAPSGADAGARPDGGTSPDGGALAAPAIFRVQFETSAGTFVVEAHRDWAPNGVDHFYQLVTSHFYDDTRVFRVLAGFVAQFGISGEPSVTARSGATIPSDPVIQHNQRGFLSYAMVGTDTGSRTTQLFIDYADNSFLDAQGFAPIAQVVSGMEVVDAFYAGYMEMPVQSSIERNGNAYLDASFPMLTRIVSATVVSP